MKSFGRWLSSIRHSYSHLSLLFGLVMVTSLTSGCSTIAKGLVSAATGGGAGLEISPETQIGRQNTSTTRDSIISAENETVTEIAGNQINSGLDPTTLLLVLVATVAVSTALGYFASDEFNRWIRNRKK